MNPAWLVPALVATLATNGPDAAPPECPDDATAVRSARVVTTDPDAPVAAQFYLLDFCSDIPWWFPATELRWRVIPDRTALPEGSRYEVRVVEPVLDGDPRVLATLPRSVQGSWIVPRDPPRPGQLAPGVSLRDVFDGLWEGRLAVQVVPEGGAPGAPIPIEPVYATGWDVLFQGARPESPPHCIGGAIATRMTSGLFPIVADGAEVGSLHLQLFELDAPSHHTYTHGFGWEMKLDPALRESLLESARVVTGTGEVAVVLEAFPPRRRGGFAELYGSDRGLWTGRVPYRDFYAALVAGDLELVLASPAFAGGEVRVPLRTDPGHGWRANCT